EAEIGGGGVLDQLREGANVFVSSAVDVEASRVEVVLVIRHRFGHVDNVLFILTHLAVGNRRNRRRRRGRGLRLGRWGGRGGRRCTALGKSSDSKGQYSQQAQRLQKFHYETLLNFLGIRRPRKIPRALFLRYR